MKVEDLIDLLQRCDPKAIVFAWDPESGDEEEVTGILFDDAKVSIHTDEP
jgi:hypothetical protein